MKGYRSITLDTWDNVNTLQEGDSLVWTEAKSLATELIKEVVFVGEDNYFRSSFHVLRTCPNVQVVRNWMGVLLATGKGSDFQSDGKMREPIKG